MCKRNKMCIESYVCVFINNKKYLCELNVYMYVWLKINFL